MEHELSAIYDITHGLGLAILAPRWMEYTLEFLRCAYKSLRVLLKLLYLMIYWKVM